MSRAKALRDWGGYAGSQYVARFAMIVRGFIVARILGPTEYGNWLALLLIYDLGSYVHLGVLNGMAREIPFELGREDEERARRLRDAGYTATVGLTLLFLLVLVVIDFTGWESFSPLTRFALPLIGMALLLQIQNFLYYNIFRSTQRFGPVSQAWALQAIVNLALSIALVLAMGIRGVVLALVLSNLITVLFLRRRADWRFRFLYDRGLIRHLMIRGGPVLAYLFVGVLLRQVDKLVILGFLSRTELGYYGIASTIAGLLIYITSSASFTLFPQFLSKFGKTGEISSLARTLKEPTYAFSIFVPVFLGFIYLWVHIPVVHLLPEFAPGVEAMRILVLGTLFLSIAALPSYFLITVNRTRVLLIGGAAIVLVEWALNVYLVKQGYGLKGVAFGAAVCQFLYGTTLLTYALRLVPDGEKHVAIEVIRTYLPSVYVAAWIALIFRMMPITPATLQADIGRGLIQGAILLVATSPLWIVLQKRTGVLTLAWGMIRRRDTDGASS